MTVQETVEKVKEYRLAVHAYCDALDRMDSTDELGQEWQRIEAAHDEAERARTAFLRQRQKPLFARFQSMIFDEALDPKSEELVLGDVGQHGG